MKDLSKSVTHFHFVRVDSPDILLEEGAVHIVLVVTGSSNSTIKLIDSQTVKLLNNSRSVFMMMCQFSW